MLTCFVHDTIEETVLYMLGHEHQYNYKHDKLTTFTSLCGKLLECKGIFDHYVKHLWPTESLRLHHFTCIYRSSTSVLDQHCSN